jgi:pimeloyl-ACP methyl ester carboxylesterase
VVTAVTMPRLGLSMAEGTVVEWRVRPGAAVRRGEILLAIESEKAEVEVEAFADGVLAAIYVEPGTTVPVGTLLGVVTGPGEEVDADAFAKAFVPETTAPPPAAPARSPAAEPAAARIAASAAVAPAARALARRLAIDVGRIVGTGPGGRVTVADVEGAASARTRAGLAHTVVGSGPPIVLVPGYAVDATGWRRQVDALADRFTVVTFDHAGVGSSRSLGDASPAIADLAADADALLRELGLGPAIVVGASMGAAVALELVLRRPEAVRALVLVTPIVERDARCEAVLRSWRDHDAPESDARIRAMLPWLLGRALLAHAGRREAAAAALRSMAKATPPKTLARHADALLVWLGTRTDALPAIDVPTLVVAGSDDILTPPPHAERLARMLPLARLEIVPEAGHAVMIEQAGILNALIAEFARV